MNKFIVSILAAGSLLLSCHSQPKESVDAISSQSDSLAYIIGMNIADNLIAMDSTININVVCRAIAEKSQSKSRFTDEQARTYYLRYLTFIEPEQRRGYEEQYLEDLAKSNRNYTRARSGLTYDIEVIGDEEFTPKRPSDEISLCYTIARVNGEQIYSSYENADTLVIALKDLNDGVQESLKMIGKGGKVNAWMPSKLAYGEAGEADLAISPFETLYYEMELIEMVVNGAR